MPYRRVMRSNSSALAAMFLPNGVADSGFSGLLKHEVGGVGDGARRGERRVGRFVELVRVAAQHVRLPQAGLEPALKCQPLQPS